MEVPCLRIRAVESLAIQDTAQYFVQGNRDIPIFTVALSGRRDEMVPDRGDL